MIKIIEQIQNYQTEVASFADKKRIEKGKIYVPESVSRFVPIAELIAVISKIKPVMEVNQKEKYLPDIKLALDKLHDLYGLRYFISPYKFLINSPNNQSDVASLSDSREGMISFSISDKREKAIFGK